MDILSLWFIAFFASASVGCGWGMVCTPAKKTTYRILHGIGGLIVLAGSAQLFLLSFAAFFVGSWNHAGLPMDWLAVLGLGALGCVCAILGARFFVSGLRRSGNHKNGRNDG